MKIQQIVQMLKNFLMVKKFCIGRLKRVVRPVKEEKKDFSKLDLGFFSKYQQKKLPIGSWDARLFSFF